MGKKTRTQTVLSVLMMVFLLIGMLPGVAKAGVGDQTLDWCDFMSSEDSTIIVGETKDLNVRLYQEDTNEPFTGAVTAYIIDAKGNQKIYPIKPGSQGDYTISKVTIDNPGDYTIYINATEPNEGSARAILKVADAVSTVTGSLVINTNNTLSVKVADSDGNLLIRNSNVVVDGTAVGASAQSYTTLYDGTFKFSMTPTLYGTVNITYFGHVIGTIKVVPAYTQNARIGGTTEDNVSLAVKVANNGWAQGARNVILARDDEFPDAMAAVPMSKTLDAPILMTDSAKLDDRTLSEMRALGVANVYIVGGIGAISQNVEDQLNDYFTVTRIFGRDRYDTAVEISKYVGEATHTVYIANGYALPDAVAASAFAGKQGIPILLTGKDEIPTSTSDALANLNTSNVVLLGGTGVISTQVENALRSKYAVERWGGNDRYDTQNIIFQNILNTQTPQSPLYFASGLIQQDDVTSGKPYADALLTAALAAKTGGFVAMLPPNTLPSSLNYFLLYNKGYISKTAVVGNYSSVSRDLEQQVGQILNR